MAHRLRSPLALTVASLFVSACGSDGGTTNQPTTCTNISGTVTKDGLSIRKPEDDANACHVIPNPQAGGPENVCEKKAPDFSCVGQSDPLGTPINVTFTGCVASFGLAAQSDDLTVVALKEQLGGASAPTDPGYDLAGTPGMQAEKTPAALVSRTMSTRVTSAECQDLGAFTLENVPTETPLIIRVTDQQYPASAREYIDTYQYNVILRSSMIRSGPTKDSPLVPDPATFCATAGNRCYVVDDVNTIGVATFRTVSLAAGVSDVRGDSDLYDGEGQGHLAGEVQDCTSEDRVQNAVVETDVPYRKMAYFNVGYAPEDMDNIDDAKVEGTRSRTNADGLYATIALDVQSGGTKVKVGAAVTRTVCGPDGVCKCKDGAANPAYTAADAGEGESEILATRTVYVYPDSITILTFDRQAYVQR